MFNGYHTAFKNTKLKNINIFKINQEVGHNVFSTMQNTITLNNAQSRDFQYSQS